MGTYRYATDVREHGFFLVKKVRGRQEASLDGEKYERQESGSPDGRRDGLGFLWEIASLREFEQGFFTGVDPTDQYIGFVDPSTYADTPGWVLRNLLVLIRHRFRLSKARILCYRDVHSKRHEARSIILNVESLASPTEAAQNKPEVPPMPSITGWERDLHGNLRPRLIDLAQYMDPGRLADQSVDLNLKLMKWRIAPDLDLERIKNAKCLLLGAGTLGSNVSRMLQGWNVRKITFVDNATVSYSNPVRQPLFAYKDCLNGGAKKALRAAEQLKEIYPGTDSSGHVISVPMLGHPIIDEKAIHQDFEQLRALIDEHDAIFLLMDTRESRWLPTLMGKAANKIVMNAALGFDTFVAMRHGIAPPEGGQAALGCYFCNDVVAPEDSMKDQTLDQQCTVTRPGLAAMASATLVELFVSILQHPLGGLAPAPGQPIDVEISEDNNHPLGIVPHQIRYFLRNFESRNIRGQSYDCCSACSSKVVDAYKAQGWNFVRRALSEKDYVTELSGLAEVHRRADAAAAEVDWDSEEGSAEDDAEAVLL
jgi:ubiquitin-like modifier-activating enzyme ATG7